MNLRAVLSLAGNASLSAIAIFTAAPVYAQGAPAGAPEMVDNTPIIVTGSRIARPFTDRKEPTSIIGSDLIDATGDLTVGDALKAMPAFGPPASSPVGGQAGTFGAGQTFIDLFGLGSQRTLVLVNGNRYVSSNTASIFGPTQPGAQVDLNTIPTLMVDRIETVAVGGAPIYGSDAIAGTVNIILKDKYQGIKLGAQTGIADRHDAAEYRLQALAGTAFGGGRGNIVAAFEYSKQEGLLATDRPVTAQGLRYVPPADPGYPYQNQLASHVKLPVLSQYGIPMAYDFIPNPEFGAAIYNGAGQSLAFNAQGQLVPIDFGAPTGSPLYGIGGNGYDVARVSNLQSPVERYVGYAKADYELTDGIKAFAEFSYAHSKGTELRSQPVYNTYLFGPAGSTDGNLIIPLSNPFLSADARATIAASLPPGQDYFYLTRANEDLASGLASTTVELYRILGGFKGDAHVLGRKFSWEVVGNYGRSKTRGEGRQLVQQNFENALAGCQPGYANAAIATISATCAPFNPFGQQNSDAVRNYITTIARPVSDNEQWVITADANGSLFSMWGGDASVVLGLEHREETSRFDPGAFYYGIPNPSDPSAPRGQYGRSIPIDPVYGKFHTNEVFGELRLPFVSSAMNVPFIDTLEVNLAGRYVDHSLAGSAFTWTAGGRWKPVEDFGFRGNYTRSIRSPAITELFNPTSQIFTTANDPCDARFLNSGPNPAVRKTNCAAAGLPADFQSTIVDFTSPGSVSGNTGLKNEVANSWTIGAFFTPRFIPGLSLSVDWVSIKLKNAIVELDAESTLNACYDASSYPSSACSQFTRNEAGQITFVKTGYLNAASKDYAGLLGELSYRTRTPFLGKDSRVGLNVSYQYIDKLEQRVGFGDVSIDTGSIGFSRHQATGTLSYDNGPWGGLVQLEYIGPAVLDANATATTYDTPHRGAVAFVDTSVHVTVQDRFTLRFMVDNVFDTKPPYPAPAGGGTITYFKGIMGRYFKVAATTKF